MNTTSNILYSELADWWPLLSDPADYAEEAEIISQVLLPDSSKNIVTLLELGSGGGNTASHLKKNFETTLVDLSPQMLKVSRDLNPECEHVQGDMRIIRLGRKFNAVLIHDAVCYMATKEHLRQALRTAFVHCRPGGKALFLPDWTKENFQPETSHGGHDKNDRALRYISWTMDLDANDDCYSSFMVYLLREGNQVRLSGLDEHIMGLFSDADWLSMIEDVGFQASKLPFDHSEFEEGTHWMFAGIKPDE